MDGGWKMNSIVGVDDGTMHVAAMQQWTMQAECIPIVGANDDCLGSSIVGADDDARAGEETIMS